MRTQAISLIGQVAVVTGANGGIGQAIVKLLAQQGAIVIATDHHPQLNQLISDQANINFRLLDVADITAIERLALEIEAEYGRLDIWVNNAGMLVRAPSLELQEAAWEKTLQVNLRASVFASQAAARVMARHGGGAIVNLSSYAGLKARPNCVDYAAAKAGVHHATKCLALEFGELGVRINCIAPGYINTNMSGWMHDNPTLKAEYLDKVPLRRVGDPMEIAMGVLYLVSPMSSFVTGHTLVIDGGVIHA